MKIIDLLNKIAKGEETHFNTKLNGKSVAVNYYNDRDFSSSTDPKMLNIGDIIRSLNDEIEIVNPKAVDIEEDKKIEKLDYSRNLTINKDYIRTGYYYGDEPLTENERILMSKINEIIDKLNKGV